MITTSGIPTYEEVSGVIESIVHTEGRKYPIPGQDFEDTAQEIRLECIRVLQFYDSNRIGPSPFKFLQTCIKNFLYNQRRGIWVPNNPPCVRCPLWDRERKTCTIDEIGCDKIIKYRKNMATKADIKCPISLEIDVTDITPEQHMDSILMDQSIRNALPDKLIPYYEKLINGRKIPNNLKTQIREIVTQVINHAEDLP